jgi:hypothetical protein
VPGIPGRGGAVDTLCPVNVLPITAPSPGVSWLQTIEVIHAKQIAT